MQLKEIAAISGKPGLFKIVKPTRAGVIVETMDDKKKKIAIDANAKVSVLKEISIYTNDEDGSVPLENIYFDIYEKYALELPVNPKSDEQKLFDFLGELIPDYDEEKVYASDIKKLVSWYLIISKQCPDLLVRKEEEKPTEEKVEEKPAAEKN